MDGGLVWQVVTSIGAGAVMGFGAYLAIRVDLRGMQVEIANMKEHLSRHERWLEKK